MAQSPSPKPFARAWLLPVSFLVVFCLVLLLKAEFAPATGELTANLPAAAAAGAKVTLKGGAEFAGRAKVKIDDEIVIFKRVTADGLPVADGKTLREYPESFIVEERGVDGTNPANHGEGTKVFSTDTVFFPENNASYGEDVDDLFYLILWITGIAFILSETFLIYCILGFKARPGEVSFYSHGNHKLEMFWTIITSFILVLLAVLQFSMWNEIKRDMPTAKDNPVRVQIIGETYKWFFRLAGNDDEFGTRDDVFAGSLTVPQGRKILVELRARDVLHSFFLPNFRVKQDAVPGMKIPLWFEAIKTGTFPVMCAELCGLGHTTMGTSMKVLPEDEWAAWLEQASSDRLEEVEEDMERPEWHEPRWWWWDRNDVPLGFPGSSSRGKKSN